MEKQSYELINGVARDYKVHTLIYDNQTNRVKFLLSIPRNVKRILKANPGISLIHLNDGLIAAFCLGLKNITDIPIVATIHGLDIVFPSRLFQRLFVRRFRHYDGLIAVSQATGQECLDRGIDPSRVFVVRNGVDTDLSQIAKKPGFRKVLSSRLGIPMEDKKILISVGRSVRRKGFSWFITKVLPKLESDVVYFIVGPTQPHIEKINFILNLLPDNLSNLISLGMGLGIDEIDIQKALRRPEVRGRAFYLGKLPFEEMVQALKHANMFVMPNIKVAGDAEGFGLVALEAAVSGVPVMASAIEGITCAVMDGKNGFLVPTENEDQWITKINAALSDIEALARFSAEAQQYTIVNYSWKRMVEEYVDVFKRFHYQYLYRREKAERMEEHWSTPPGGGLPKNVL